MGLEAIDIDVGIKPHEIELICASEGTGKSMGNSLPRAFVVHVNVRENGKVIGWLSTDAIEEEIAFNKDRFSAFEYPSRDDAEKAVGVITLELGIFDAEVMGVF